MQSTRCVPIENQRPCVSESEDDFEETDDRCVKNIDYIRKLIKRRLSEHTQPRPNGDQPEETYSLTKMVLSTTDPEKEGSEAEINEVKYRKLIKSILEYYGKERLNNTTRVQRRCKEKVNYAAETFQCPICNKKFEFEEICRYHYDTCRFQGNDTDRVIESLKNETPRKTNSKPFCCILCRTHYKSKESLEKHNMLNHMKNYYCIKCNLKFENSIKLNRHFNFAHKTQQPHVCHICRKVFSMSSSLRKHLAYHKSIENKKNRIFSNSKTTNIEGPLRCNICRKVFSLNSSLRKHLAYHKSIENKKNEASSNDKDNSLNGERVKCAFCTTTFAHVVSYKRHMRKFHHQVKQMGLVKCKICPAVFQWPHSVKRHMERFHTEGAIIKKPHKCQHCDKCFQYPYLLVHHNKKCIGDEYVTCSICKITVKATYLRRHIQRKHT